jgi:IclR family transcriptional regulator, acetate operon repressor
MMRSQNIEGPPRPGRRRRSRTSAAPAGSGGHTQTLVRGITLLERLAESPRGLTLTDLAQGVGLSPSTTHRLLATLEREGFVRQTGDLGLWQVGLRAFVVGNAFLASRDLLARSHPYLRRLMEGSGETANLAVLDGYEAVFVDQVQCLEMMRMQTKIGSRAPLHASGVGKALLAAMDDEHIEEFLHRRGLPRITASSIATPQQLREAIQDIRRLGYAYDNEEHARGLRCLAAALYDEHADPVAAISIAGPRSRVSDDRIVELGVLVVRTAHQITQDLGGIFPG